MAEITHESDRPAKTRDHVVRHEDEYDAREPAASSMPARDTHVDGDLRDSLVALSKLSIGRLDLKDLLTQVAHFAVAAIPGAEGAGLTLMEKGHRDTIVASAPFVSEVDAIQYSIGEGPCITAVLDGRTVHSGGLNSDTQWPRFGTLVAVLGVHSVLSLPLLILDRTVLGAMNIYAHTENAFDDQAVQIGEMFAVPAAIAVQNAQALAQTKRVTRQLQTALTSRAVIDQALGILMSRTGSTAEEAFSRLRERSQADNAKLRDVAQSVVNEAVRRARARRATPTPR
jgi:GAF domain-containing protein